MNKYAARAVRKQAKKNTKRLKAIPTRAKLLFKIAMAPNNRLKTHPLKLLPLRLVLANIWLRARKPKH
jgi:uncharacterized protein (UPF0262 family)